MNASSLRRTAGFLAVLVAWQALAVAGAINPFLMPPPTRLAEAAYEPLADGSLFRHVVASLERVLVGFLLAALCGMALGILLGWSRLVSDFLQPLVECLRPIPPIAWTPIAILWFGVGNAPSYFPVFIGAIFPVFVSVRVEKK